MTGVLSGFVVVGLVLAVGYLLARFNTLGDTGSTVLSSFTFSVGLPALIFSTLATNDVREIFAPTALVSILGCLAVMLIVVVVGSIRKWGTPKTVIGAMSVGFVNSTNLGIPLSVYILGSAIYVTPIMLYQLAILTPVALAILDITDPTQPPRTVAYRLTSPFRNPVTVAAIVGVIISATGMPLPTLLLEPIMLIAGATVPLMLIIFGMSLHGFGTEEKGSDRGPTTVTVIAKSLIQPVLAYVLAAYVFHLDARSTLVVLCCAALPTGQNVVIYAMRYRVGQSLARSTAIITTVLAIPLLLVSVALFG